MSEPTGPAGQPLPEPSKQSDGVRHRRLPFADRALTLMLFVLVVDLFLVVPLSEMVGGTRHWSFILLMSVLVLGAMVIWGNLWLTDMFVAGALACIASRLGYIWWGNDGFLYAGYTLATGAFTILIYLLARRVFAPGRINVHRIEGAIAVYLLAGMMLSQVLLLISISYPGAFLHLGHPASHEDISGSMGYYAFVTLTTLGFGDITPVHPLARSFTVLGAVFGTLYPAILIGRLVQQEMVHGGR